MSLTDPAVRDVARSIDRLADAVVTFGGKIADGMVYAAIIFAFAYCVAN